MKTRIEVISLDENTDETINLLESVRNQGLAVNVFPAVDGRKNLPELEKGEIIDQQTAVAKRLVSLTNTEIACYLSHLRAIKNAYADGMDKLCLLEDDVKIEENFHEITQAVFNLGDEFEFVRLMGLKRKRRKKIAQLSKEVWLTIPVKGLCGTQGYVINRRGMKKVIAKGSSVSEPIDKFYDHFWESGLHCFAVEPHIIWEESKQSSVAKKSISDNDKKLSMRLKKRYLKFLQSVRRQCYLLRRIHKFYPAHKPVKNLGKTARIH